MFQTSPLKTLEELSSLYPSLLLQPQHWGGLIVNSLPLNHSTKLSSRWDAGKTEKEDQSQKTEQRDGCILSCVCICSMTSLAMPVRMECWCLSSDRIIFQERQIRGISCFFFCLLTASSDWPHKLALGIWSMTRKLNKLTHWQFIRFCGGIYWCCLRQMINSD